MAMFILQIPRTWPQRRGESYSHFSTAKEILQFISASFYMISMLLMDLWAKLMANFLSVFEPRQFFLFLFDLLEVEKVMFAVTLAASKAGFADGLALDHYSEVICEAEAPLVGVVDVDFSGENIAVLVHVLSSKVIVKYERIKNSIIYASKYIATAYNILILLSLALRGWRSNRCLPIWRGQIENKSQFSCFIFDHLEYIMKLRLRLCLLAFLVKLLLIFSLRMLPLLFAQHFT